MKPTAPGSLSHIFAFAVYFYSACIFRSIKPKIQKYLAAIYSYLFYLVFDLSIYYNLSHVRFAYLEAPYPERIDNPFYTSGCEYLLFVCRCYLPSVVWFSYWFDNLGLIMEGNTCRCCAASSLPLWGNMDVVLANINNNNVQALMDQARARQEAELATQLAAHQQLTLQCMWWLG